MIRAKAPIALTALAIIAGTALAQVRPGGRACRVVTDASGTYLVRDTGPVRPWRFPGGPSGADAVLWTYPDGTAIPESCSFSPFTGSAWVGQHLNGERLQRFPITGPGTPTFEYLGHHVTFNPSAVSAAAGADLAVYLDQQSQGGQLRLIAFRAGSGTPAWTYDVHELYVNTDIRSFKVSRDGSTVAIAAATTPPQGVNPDLAVIFLNGSNGSFRSQWLGSNGGCSGVDLTDDGSRAIICHVTPPAGVARLIETATGTEVRMWAGNGAGGEYNISGDGRVVVIGGFDFRVFVNVNGTWVERITFNAPGSWFAWASAVSRDGSTVGALAHNYLSNYLNTDTRLWDVAEAELLGTFSTVGSGTLQDSAWGAAMADNGSRLAVCSWGDEAVSHPQFMVFDRTANLIGSITTAGSAFSIDMTGDGRYVMGGNKAVHANIFGNGGLTTLLELPITQGCYPNCDGSTVPPVLNVSDFSCFINRFNAGDSYANCDDSTTPPMLNVSDFACFINRFNAGCP